MRGRVTNHISIVSLQSERGVPPQLAAPPTTTGAPPSTTHPLAERVEEARSVDRVMRTTLVEPEFLRASAIRRLTFGAMVASAWLAPIVLGMSTIVVGNVPMIHGTLLAAALSMLPAAALGGWAMHAGAKARSWKTTLAVATFGGVLFLAAATTAYLEVMIGAESVGHGLGLMVVAALFACFGTVVSAPTGFAFGLLFLAALHPMTRALEAPAQDTPARAALASASLLTLSSVLAFLALLPIGQAYESFVQGDLHLALGSWTRFPVLAGPLALAALAFALIGRFEKQAHQRTRRAIVEGLHAEYAPSELAPDVSAVPLTEFDRKSADLRVVLRRDVSAYRGDAGLDVRVYVGLDSMSARRAS